MQQGQGYLWGKAVPADQADWALSGPCLPGPAGPASLAPDLTHDGRACDDPRRCTPTSRPHPDPAPGRRPVVDLAVLLTVWSCWPGAPASDHAATRWALAMFASSH